jgi:vacuolar iron transporter family protein
MSKRHKEGHPTRRIGWLRAAVLGANDGIVSTASLIVGVAVAHASHAEILAAGLAGLVGGAMSMAAGEYVSVSSQADSEQAQTEVERRELESDSASEHLELANIYVKRGLDQDLARQVAEQLMAHDALDAHLRDELGITETRKPRPLQAAMASLLTFSCGAAIPLIAAVFLPPSLLVMMTIALSLLILTSMGALAARAGGASVLKGALRVLIWGAFAMAATAGIGALFHINP